MRLDFPSTTEYKSGVRAVRFRPWLAACAAACWCACADGSAPLPRLGAGSPVRDTHLSRSHEALQRIAVLPFAAAPGAAATATADALASVFAQALSARGLAVIPPGDLSRALRAEEGVVPRLDPRRAAEFSQREFGATSVALGRVLRWREREGSAVGSTRPASVAFEVSLYAAPLPRRLWSGNFDETQRSLTENLLRARQYPGSGTRWLSASELAQWGAAELARTLVE
jgi:hypothetical protein